jgi:hypothetical protein
MRFDMRHKMPRSASVAWQAFFFDDAYQVALQAQAAHDAETLERATRGGLAYVKTRVTSHKKLPSFMARSIGSDRLSYVLEQWRDDAKLEMRWKVTPPTAHDKIKAEGRYRLVANPTGCERLVNGEIKVSIALVGGKIEKAIGGELQRSYEKSAVFASDWLLANTTELA